MQRFTPRRRDAFRVGVSTLTSLVGVGSLTAVGWFAGTAARQHDREQARTDAAHAAAVAKAAAAKARYDAAMAARRSAALPRRVVLRPRPTRTEVEIRYSAPTTPSVTLGGGTLGSPPVHGSPVPSGPVHHAPPPPPPPPPPPAPSSGS